MKTKIILLSAMIASASVAFTQTQNDWIGGTDNEWSTDSNWSLGHAPTSNEEVYIDASGDSVHLDISTSVKELHILNGAFFNYDDNFLDISGTWENSGGIEYSNGASVRLTGIVNQNVLGNHEIDNLICNNPYSVTITSSAIVKIEQQLNVMTGTLVVQGELKIQHDAGIAPLGELYGSIQGNVIVQKQFGVEQVGWRYLASPVKNTTLNQIEDDMWTTGYPGSTYANSTVISVYFYDETVNGSGEYGYTAPNHINDTIAAGTGFMSYMGTGNFGGTLDFVGKLNHGNVSLPVSYTNTGDSNSDGWSLVGNPFASTLDWDHNSITRTNVDDAIYVWSGDNQNYASYVDGISTNGGSNLISSCQAFWVKANAANPELTFPQGAKSNNSSTFIKSSGNNDYVAITLSNGGLSDETVIRGNELATKEFEGTKDALKMNTSNGGSPTVFTSFDGVEEKFAINQFEKTEQTLKLWTLTGQTGLHTLTFEGVAHFSDHQCVIVEDLFTGDLYELNDSTSIEVVLSDTTTIPRFEIKIGAPVYVQEMYPTCNGLNDGNIKVAKNTATVYDIILKDDYGFIVEEANGVFQLHEFDNLTGAEYNLEVFDALCGMTSYAIEILEPAAINANFEVVNDSVFIEDAVAIEFVNNSSNAYYYTWEIEMHDNTAEDNPAIEFEMAGEFMVTLNAFQNENCFESMTKTVTVLSTADVIANEFDDVKIYANDSQLMIQGHETPAQLIITNMAGQILRTTQIQSDIDQIDLGDIAHQVLIVTLIIDEKAISKKLNF